MDDIKFAKTFLLVRDGRDSMMPEKIKNYIDGKWVNAIGKKEFE